MIIACCHVTWHACRMTKMSGEKDSSKDFTVFDVFVCVLGCCVSLFSYLGLLAFDRRTICFTQKMLPELFLPSCLYASEVTGHCGKVVIEKRRPFAVWH